MISRKTVCILVTPGLTSTSGRAPALSATMRFWIRVDSLNRPPTLRTTSSCFSSSSTVVSSSFAKDSFDVADGLIELVVDHLIVVRLGTGQLLPRAFEAASDRLFVVGGAETEPALIFVHRRSFEEDQHRLGELPLDLQRPLNVDFQEDRPAAAEPGFHLASQGPVEVPEDLRTFYELSALSAPVELLAGEKMVMDAVHLAGAGHSRGGRDGGLQGKILPLQQPPGDRRLSGPAPARER